MKGTAYMTYSITHWYQPIYDFRNWEIIGTEALIRCNKTSKVTPDKLFKNAELQGILSKLDLFSIYRSISNYNLNIPLFINVYPETLANENFLSWWDMQKKPSNNIVLELSEKKPIEDWESLKYTVKQLRKRNVKIAVDDFGAGNSSLRHWIELEPELIKLDRYFVLDLKENKLKQKVIQCLVELVQQNTQIIAEGIESSIDLSLLKKLGIRNGQGYLLGRPSPLKNDFNIYKKH